MSDCDLNGAYWTEKLQREKDAELQRLRDDNVRLKQEVLDEFMVSAGERARLTSRLSSATKMLINLRQFLTWVCEDSIKYNGTEIGRACKSKRVDIDKCLEKIVMGDGDGT